MSGPAPALTYNYFACEKGAEALALMNPHRLSGQTKKSIGVCLELLFENQLNPAQAQLMLEDVLTATFIITVTTENGRRKVVSHEPFRTSTTKAL